MNHASLKSWLVGHWLLKRMVIQHDTLSQYSMQGSASFASSKDSLIYNEWGEISCPHYQGNFYQTYIFKFCELKGICVFFKNGDLFHYLNFESDFCSVEHKCKNDLYNGTFSVVDDETLKIRWKVVGPKKNMDIFSTLRKTQAI